MKTRNQIIILNIFFFFLIASINVKAQEANFSGRWQLDKNRTNFKIPMQTSSSNFSDYDAPEYVISRALRITQTQSGLIIDRTNLTATLDEKHYIQQISLTGKSSQTLSITGNTEIDSLDQKFENTGLMIGITTITPNGDPSFNAIETWSLTDDGQTLIIDRQVNQHDGMKYEIKGYYTKQ